MCVSGEIVAVELDHPVREAGDDLGGTVHLAVPARVDLRRQPEIGAQIDDVADVVDHPG